MKNILILEDDSNLNDGIKLSLHNSNYQLYQCKKISEARQVMRDTKIDLILLDINLPDGSGIDYLQEIRSTSDVPVIIITANNMESDIVIGLELGANDYITKPFSLMVLRARVSVQLRENKKSTLFQSDDFDFDFDKMLFKVRNQSVELSKVEQRLLRLLITNKGATLKREYLIDNIWSGDSQYVDEHALTVSIQRLRNKIEKNPSQPQFIKTVYGLGYSWSN